MQIRAINNINFGIIFSNAANNAIKNQMNYYNNAIKTSIFSQILSEERDWYIETKEILECTEPYSCTMDIKPDGSVVLKNGEKETPLGKVNKDKNGNRIGYNTLNNAYFTLNPTADRRWARKEFVPKQ